ncbi:alpha/beta-hydrolase [Tribonema minus]|uniref:Alpha/beta-hydrolase n=1 Tax=Tribonema minus TaxID=303371 RepID=A0A835Z8H3_9STRA|nr:alpha/beta-hydrolase [Tribonema minus]
MRLRACLLSAWLFAVDGFVVPASRSHHAVVVKAEQPANALNSESTLIYKRWDGGGSGSSANTSKQLLLYLPGIEGLAISAAASQFPALSDSFDVYSLMISSRDRSTFEDLIGECSSFLEGALAMRSMDKAVLVGESFGGVLALALAGRRPELIQQAFTINPATSFPDTAWPRLGRLLVRTPPPVYTLASLAVFMASIPDADQIMDVAGELLDPRRTTPLSQRPLRLARRVYGLFRQISEVAANLPQGTLDWRLQEWMVRGTALTIPLLSTIPVSVTVIAGTADRLLPSAAEAQRLSGIIPDCSVVELRGHGHAALFDTRASLYSIVNSKLTPSQLRSTEADVTSGNMKPGVSEFKLPDANTVALARRAVGVLRRGVSPVFFSTRADGTIVEGLGALPDVDPNRPILFVANHQYLAMDLSLIYDQLLEEKNILPRGLGHPAIFDGRAQPGPLGTFVRDVFSAFGAVPVSGKNLFKLLRQKEAVLLFPGGAREAYHLRGEENQLFWPDKSEAIRMAVSTNAIIVPFSAIGAAESFNVILDTRESLDSPLIGPTVQQVASDMPSVRGGDDLFVAPLAIPRLPRRQYFLFAPAIYTDDINKNDRERCDTLYIDVKQAIFQGIELLLRARESDFYDDPVRRLAYEALSGGKPAPTFPLYVANKLQRDIKQ